MKKLLLLTLFITLTFIGFSQFPGNLSGYYIKALTAVVISGDTLSNTTQLSLSDTTAATKGYVDLIGSPWPTDTVQFTTDQVGLPYKEGRLYYDANKGNPVFFGSEPDVSLDIGRELWIEINNPTAGTLTNGKLVYFSGGASGKNANINLADNRYWETVSAIGMLTHDIETGTFGLTTTNGTVHDITTIGETEGDEVYVGHNGDWTTARPVYPEFEYEVGFIQYAATDSGSIYIAPKGQIDDIFHNLSAGSIIEDFDFTISSTGSVITGELNAEPGARDSLTFFFSDSYSTLATPVTIVLSAGTDASEQINYTYILKSTKALANSTAYWPAVEHIPISISSLQSAATTLTRDIVRNQNMISHTADIHTQMGRLDHISKRIRTLPAKFLKGSGANLTVTGSGTTTVTLSTTSAKVWQLHLDNFDAIDISTDYLIVPNDDTSPGTWINDLTDITTDATGASLNNKYFTVVIGGIQNSATEPDHLYMMMPEGSYNSSDAAVANGDGYTNYVVPDNYDGVGFLMYALTFGASSTSTVWTLTNTVNLRGLFPNTVAGAGSSGGTGDEAYTDHSDTPNSFVGDGNKFVRVASGETALEHVAASIINVSDFNDDGTYFHKTNDDSDDIIEGVVNLFNQTHTSEVTGSGALTIASGVIDEDNLDATNVPTDNYVLSYNLAGTNFTWVPSVSGATQLSELSDVVSATNTNRFALMANGTTGYVGRAVVEADISDLTHTDGDAIHDNINGEINAIAIKTSPTTSDILVIEDAAVSFSKKKITLGAFETLISGSFLPYTGATGSLTMGENDIATRQLTMGTATAPDATITAHDDLTLAGGSGIDGSASILFAPYGTTKNIMYDDGITVLNALSKTGSAELQVNGQAWVTELWLNSAGTIEIYATGNDMYFNDINAGPVTLSTLVAGGAPTFADISTNSINLADYTVKLASTVDWEWRNSVNSIMWQLDEPTSLLSGANIRSTQVQVDNAATFIDKDGGGNMTLEDAVTGSKTLAELASGGAPTDVNYLVGTADAGLSNEIVVGTTPGGDLGNTWAAPSVDNDSHNHTQSTVDLTHEDIATNSSSAADWTTKLTLNVDWEIRDDGGVLIMEVREATQDVNMSSLDVGDIEASGNIEAARYEIDNSVTYIDRDGSTNMTFTDAVTGTKTLAELAASGSGVTSVAAGNGLDFTTITTTGSVTLGTPSTITASSTNQVTATSHTHLITSLTTSEFASANVSQWTNDANYADKDLATVFASTLKAKQQLLTTNDESTQGGTFIIDATLGDIHYGISSATGAVTINIDNLAEGAQGTAYVTLNAGATSFSVTGSDGFTTIQDFNTKPTISGGEIVLITYTAYNTTKVSIVYGIL